MRTNKCFFRLLLFCSCLVYSFNTYGQLTLDVGNDTTYCSDPNTTAIPMGIKVDIKNGVGPYTYAWECKFVPNGVLKPQIASDVLNDSTLMSPTFIDGVWLYADKIKFILHVTDQAGQSAKDSLNLRFLSYACTLGYRVVELVQGDSVWLDAGNPSGSVAARYWEPSDGLSTPRSSATWCKPTVTTNYSIVSVDTSGCIISCHAYEIRVIPTKDFQTVYANRVALFDNSTQGIIGLRVDSVKVDSDTILYPFTTIHQVSENCYSPFKASWIGEKVVLKADGTNQFFNREGGVVTLKTRARINEPWIAFQRADTFRVEASVQSVELGNVLGLSDSVKTIAFRVLDQQGITVDHAVNKLKVKISKRYGFVETLNFYLFPDPLLRYPTDFLRKYTLVGLTHREVGVQNLTWFDVNGFNPGDELHVQEHKLGDRYFLSPFREYDNRSIYKYLERTDYADSIVYRYARNQSIETIYKDSTTLETYNDTLKSVVLANPVFDQLPGEPIIEENSAYQMYMLNDEFLMKINPRITELYVGSGDCLGIFAGEGCLYQERYIAGLGGPYYSCLGLAGDSEERKLVYYKKGETEWGNRLIITGVSNLKTDARLQVFPNPARDVVTFQLDDDAGTHEVRIYSQTGTLVKSEQFRGSSCVLKLRGLKSGIYLYKLTSSHSLIYTGKLVVD